MAIADPVTLPKTTDSPPNPTSTSVFAAYPTLAGQLGLTAFHDVTIRVTKITDPTNPKVGQYTVTASYNY